MPSFSEMNRLAAEKSPYLLQHAANPVDWYPWGEEAFRRARETDRPIFLSIGYATCHWCHVMEHESFEDPEVAQAMNDALISVKVDREERPDVDEQYMTVCTLLTGSGGWPLTVVLTPDARPFFAATYLNKRAMLDLIPKIREVWSKRRAEVEKSAGSILEALKDAARGGESGATPGVGVLAKGYAELREDYDEENGGFGGAPKFPSPHNITFLLRYHHRSGDARALRMAEETLDAMRRGGLYDHVGHGFHRYSTDDQWLVPHFEKMLYDQSLLALAYLEAAQATGKTGYAATARDVLSYVRRDLLLPEGAFASAEDADSEGVEGKFYVWTWEELRDALEPGPLGELVSLSGVSAEGNFQDPFGHAAANILHLPAGEEGVFPEHIRVPLFRRRADRVRPLRDDKILADWNGLAIAALARASWVTGEKHFLHLAEGAVRFVLDTMRSPDGAGKGRLLHRYRDGVAAIPAFATDHAYLIWGLLELYGATFSPPYLRAALDLGREMVELFVESAGAGLSTLYLTARDAEPLLVRPRGAYDGALPSAVSTAVMDLFRLGRMAGDAGLVETAISLVRALSGPLEHHPRGFTFLLGSLDHLVGPAHEIVVTGEPEAPDTVALLETARRAYLPGAVLLYRPPGDGGEIAELAPFTRPLTSRNGRATAYVCRDHVCSLPITDPGEMLRQLAR